MLEEIFSGNSYQYLIYMEGGSIMCCPYCYQGKIVKAVVKNSGEMIFICEECDTVWTSHEKISDATGLVFSLYADMHNMKPLWSELELLQ